jgi:site-specific DNA recombinase
VKKGTRYRYYVSTALVTGFAKRDSPRLRIPAGNLEGLMLDRLRSFLNNRAEILLDAITQEPDSGASPRQVFERGRQIADELRVERSETVKAIVMTLVRRVEIRADCVQISISRAHLSGLLTDQSVDLPPGDDDPDNSSDDALIITATAGLARVGREMKMLLDDQDAAVAADRSLLRVIARAHDIQTRLTENTALSVHDVANEERVSAAYIYNLLRLPWLAPDITTAIINGRHPQQLNAKALMRQASRLPADWAEQRTLLGFN